MMVIAGVVAVCVVVAILCGIRIELAPFWGKQKDGEHDDEGRKNR